MLKGVIMRRYFADRKFDGRVKLLLTSTEKCRYCCRHVGIVLTSTKVIDIGVYIDICC